MSPKIEIFRSKNLHFLSKDHHFSCKTDLIPEERDVPVVAAREALSTHDQPPVQQHAQPSKELQQGLGGRGGTTRAENLGGI